MLNCWGGGGGESVKDQGSHKFIEVDYVRDHWYFKLRGGFFKNQGSSNLRGGLFKKPRNSSKKGWVM